MTLSIANLRGDVSCHVRTDLEDGGGVYMHHVLWDARVGFCKFLYSLLSMCVGMVRLVAVLWVLRGLNTVHAYRLGHLSTCCSAAWCGNHLLWRDSE